MEVDPFRAVPLYPPPAPVHIPHHSIRLLSLTCHCKNPLCPAVLLPSSQGGVEEPVSRSGSAGLLSATPHRLLTHSCFLVVLVFLGFSCFFFFSFSVCFLFFLFFVIFLCDHVLWFFIYFSWLLFSLRSRVLRSESFGSRFSFLPRSFCDGLLGWAPCAEGLGRAKAALI